MYQYHNLAEGHLDPCAYSMTYNVTEENGVKVLNAILNQRSQDMLAANGWNIAQYAILLMMLAQEADMVPGELIHVIADAHIYDRHVGMIKTLLDRKEYDAPIVRLNPDKKNFYDFTTDDLIIENYQYGEQIKNIPIAV
jgi:thymidylate synthase